MALCCGTCTLPHLKLCGTVEKVLVVLQHECTVAHFDVACPDLDADLQWSRASQLLILVLVLLEELHQDESGWLSRLYVPENPHCCTMRCAASAGLKTRALAILLDRRICQFDAQV